MRSMQPCARSPRIRAWGCSPPPPSRLCKRYPSPGVLLLRGFAPASVRARFDSALARYEMRDVIGESFVDHVPLASGCFLLVRTPLMKALGGFDPRYFMYFEDYDLSLRVAERATVAYEPAVRIVHHDRL